MAVSAYRNEGSLSDVFRLPDDFQESDYSASRIKGPSLNDAPFKHYMGTFLLRRAQYFSEAKNRHIP